MPQFRILAGDEVIGSTSLEHGDPPMGVAFGRFVPTERYAAFRKQESANIEQGLSLQAPDGTSIPCPGGVRITDMSHELEDEPMEVEALGIPYPLYERLFPEHVAAYDKRFS